jgi:hypothetical protein
MTLVRIAPDGAGPALFEEVEIPFATTDVHGAETEIFPAQEIAFVWTRADFALDFHAASRRRIILVLDGQMEIEDGRGDCRVFGKGDLIDVCDTSGQGHKTRIVGGRDMHTALIEIGDKIIPDWPLIEGSDHRTTAWTRTATGSDGGSCFVDETLVHDHQAPLGPSTAPMPLAGYQFVFKPATLNHSFHNAPQRQFVLNLSSGMEVETSDGVIRKFKPGEVFLGDDTTGQGHKTRALDGQSRLGIFARLS